MKTLLLFIMLIAPVMHREANSNVPPTENGFCQGWDNGYVAGWCYGDVYCIEPIVPICPIQRINENGYLDGYNRGFLAGMTDRSQRPW